MVFPVSSGHPQYSGNFIPELWAGKLIEHFYDATVLAAISNTDYEGEIKKFGDTVHIRTTPTINIFTYTKGMTLPVQRPDSEPLELLIDKGIGFNAALDDVDKVQSDINHMDTWTKDASERMKINVDQDVLENMLPDIAAENQGQTAGAKTASFDLGVAGSPITVSSTGVSGTVSITNLIVDIGTVLDEANAPENDRFLVLPAKAVGLIKKSELKDASLSGDSTSILRNGRVGMIDRFTIYMSHNLLESNGEFNIIAGHKRGLTFASQMTNMETMRSETTFASLIRGLQVYGFKVVKPEALATAVIDFE